MCDGRIVSAVAFFDTIEFTDFWTRVQPSDGKAPGQEED
jgi:hypothetical protein